MQQRVNTVDKKQKGRSRSLLSTLLTSAIFVTLVGTVPTQVLALTDDTAQSAKAEKKSPPTEQKEAKKAKEKDPLRFLKVRDVASKDSFYRLPNPDAKAGVGDPGLSLRIKSKNVGDNFLYLREVSDKAQGLTLTDNILSSQASALVYNSSRLGLILNPSDKDNPQGTGFEVALQGSMFLSVNDTLRGANDAAMDRQYAVGLSVGYSGFNLDASVLEQSSLINSDYSGYGVGFSYSTKKLWARLGFQDLTLKSDSVVDGQFITRQTDAVTDLNSLELQAAFSLSRSWQLTGGVRYSRYGKPIFGLDAATQETSQSFYLGTRWSF